ncbi:MAG: hypothetical protein LUC87_03930, partial [Clostridiales bacterium]|nr:hypothetical protein [Clostridiales bacterium]
MRPLVFSLDMVLGRNCHVYPPGDNHFNAFQASPERGGASEGGGGICSLDMVLGRKYGFALARAWLTFLAPPRKVT